MVASVLCVCQRGPPTVATVLASAEGYFCLSAEHHREKGRKPEGSLLLWGVTPLPQAGEGQAQDRKTHALRHPHQLQP